MIRAVLVPQVDTAPTNTLTRQLLTGTQFIVATINMGRFLPAEYGFFSNGFFGAGTPYPYGKALQTATVGSAYSETIFGINGLIPYTFSVISGSLPTGLSLNSSTGVISGTPTTAGTSTFTIQATDANGLIGSAQFSIQATSGGGGSGGSFVFIS